MKKFIVTLITYNAEFENVIKANNQEEILHDISNANNWFVVPGDDEKTTTLVKKDTVLEIVINEVSDNDE